MKKEEGLFSLANGRYVASKELSQKLYYIKSCRPELPYLADSTGYSWDEGGMADLFSECYKCDTRYCPEAKTWYTYKDGRWQKDISALIVASKIKEFVRLMSIYSGVIENEEMRRQYSKFVSKMGDRRFRDRILKDAAGSMQISATEFDAKPYLINCKNGTYDLANMVFREHKYDDFLTMQTNFTYTNQNPVCERFEQFIDEIMQGDTIRADYLQRALGYSILGTSKEECMFILYGSTTRNGKSTLLAAVQNMLGDYSTVAPVELICKNTQQKNAEAANPVLAKLKGKRFVCMAESDAVGKLDEATIKQYTGGEEISARELYQSAITYKPQFTLWLSCNDLPAVRDKSLFASERLRIIEFNRHFTEEEQDKSLKDYFETKDAMKGIFTWLVAGYAKYAQYGLSMPEPIRTVVKQYERDNDLVLQFLEERCVRDPTKKTPAKQIYDTYKSWCKSNGCYVCSAKKFNAELTAHPDWYIEKFRSTGMWFYGGLKVR